MNYDIAKLNGEPGINEAMPFGEMPAALLASKYEETDMDDDENMYDTYARTALRDMGPDRNKFEHEESRGGVNKTTGRLQLQYYGYKGDGNGPNHSEMYLDGLDTPDPRGVNVDPDMREYRRQEDARMRFIRWDPDGCEQITGGARSESQAIADQQKIFKNVRGRLKVFDRQIDGRTPQSVRTHDNVSTLTQQIGTRPYGDHVDDGDMTLRGRANIICDRIINTNEYRSETIDSEFEVAKYSQSRRGKKESGTGLRADIDTDLTDGDSTAQYKAVGLLMADLVRQKRDRSAIVRGSDAEYGRMKESIAMKTGEMSRDLAVLLHSITTDGKFAASVEGANVKGVLPTVARPGSLEVYNHSLPAHHYLNADILYKTARSGANIRKARDKIVTSTGMADHIITSRGRNLLHRLKIGAKLDTADDTVKAESARTYNYKLGASVIENRAVSRTTGDIIRAESDDSIHLGMDSKNYRNPSRKDNDYNMRFLDNDSKERLLAGVGSKYMMRYIDRDSRIGAQFAQNA